MERQSLIDRIGLARQTHVIETGSTANPVLTLATIKCGINGGGDGGIADAHFPKPDQVRLASHGFHAIGDGCSAHLIVQSRFPGDVAGGQFQRQLEHAQIDFVQPANL